MEAKEGKGKKGEEKRKEQACCEDDEEGGEKVREVNIEVPGQTAVVEHNRPKWKLPKA